MSKKKLLVLLLTAAVSFVVGYGATATAWHQENHGYFKGGSDTAWDDVWKPSSRTWTGDPGDCWGGGGLAIPMAVDTVPEFVYYVTCKLWYGSTQDRIGAAFMISTMTGQKNINPPDPLVDEWVRRLNYANSRGWIRWNETDSCSQPNTFYQMNRQDVGYHWDCATGSNQSIEISNGTSWYIIKRYCANPVGEIPVLADDLDFDMSGTTKANATNVSPGQVVTFTHTLTNNGPTATNPTTINWTTQQRVNSGSWSTVASNNAGTFNSGQTKTPSGSSESFPVPNSAAPGTQYCRRITWNPDTEAGGSQSSTPACVTVQHDFNLTPGISMTLTETGETVTGIIEPGESVTISYTVFNSGPTVSQTVACTYRQATYEGYRTDAPQTAFTPSDSNCPPSRTFPSNTTPSSTPATQTATETIDTTSLANRSVCRSFTITPAKTNGDPSTATACFHVGTKPYFRVFSGDIIAGGGFMNAGGACTLNSRAAVIGWNKGSSAAYAGAGVQYAALAMHQIFEVATSGAPGGAQPSGHSFANNNATQNSPANGRYGGYFGGVQCTPDYFRSKPSTPNFNDPILSGALSGTYYKNNGNLQINGATIAAGTKATVYVAGDVYISDNIVYGGSGGWDANSIPTFRLIVEGNIFIKNSVVQLDGLYVAQPKAGDATSGRIYTCQTDTSPYAPLALDGQLASQCATKLTVNGAFIAKQVWLMRTAGTLRQSAGGENPGAANIAEVFNLNPALWISQPFDAGGSRGNRYDSISSLPPVL